MADKKASCRVYFVTHEDGRLTGILMRTREFFFDGPPPAAYGTSEEDVLQRLAFELAPVIRTGDMGRYLWNEKFNTRSVRIDVHPSTVVKKQSVIGKSTVPLRIAFAWSETSSGAYRVVLPRFGWWMILEDLDIAEDAVRNAVSAGLLGSNARWIYDFRLQGEEYVKEWTPKLIESSDTFRLDDELDGPPTTSAVAEEWVHLAKRRRLPAVLGDDPVFQQNVAVFERTPRPSVLLVGEPGVGKTALVQRLARHFVRMGKQKERSVPRIWATSADRILAGMMYVGQWQERVLGLMEELESEDDYLYVDRLTGILRAQSTGASIADLLLPAVASRTMALIAECTPAELVRARRDAPGLVDNFSIIRVPEPAPSQTLALMELYNERKKGPALDARALNRAIQHLDVFRPDQSFPGKAFRFMDWLHTHRTGRGTMYPVDVSKVFAKYSGLPVELVADEFPATVKDISSRLRTRVVGQDPACEVAARVIVPLKAGLNNPERPVGCMFFAGPTGVGKTELAKQLARYMFGDSDRMVRIDMSEYMVPGSSARLMEVGRGVRSLAENVRQQPLSLVLFDEVEKAHPEVFDLLLGILGEGRLTDSQGRHVDFRMTVIVLTSNLGVSDKPPTGFGAEAQQSFERAVRDYFRPEFVGRLDAIVSFDRLSRETVAQIVDIILDEAARRMGIRRRNITLRVQPKAKEVLARLGYHPVRGARPLKRVIEERVITPLAVRMASDPSFSDLMVRVVASGAEASDVIVVGDE